MNGTFWKNLFLFSLLCSVHVAGRRGGGGGFGRSGGFGSRGSSAARASSSKSGGGWFGGGGSKSTSGTGMGTHHGGGISQPNYGRSGSGTGTGGGIFGSKTGSGGGGYRTSTFSGSGIGSRSRSDTFKNMIVGAAAGYLTYQAGKAIIRSMAVPMTWGERNYYWGQQYYPGGGYSSGKTMCRMPLDNDPRFGDIYTPEGSRPKEIVWSCSYNEQCCGYECCPGPGYEGGYQPGYSGWNSGRGIGLGTIVLLLLICCCGAFILKKFFDQKRQNNEQTFVHNNKEGYQPGHASYTASTAPDGPPPYPAATSSGGYPPENGFRYPPA